ncbi:MAG: glycosyltransferase family 2 protein [Gammaproteobacteria bacterium]|nr:glycosyltransferase family 2 protein [Gammaproteobacteria bacterium]
MEKLTVCLLTYNSSRLLEQCLTPLLRVADDFVVVDSGSSDATLGILSGYGIKPVSRNYTTHSDQMNFAISLAQNEWVLCMDSDEILDEQTVNNIVSVKKVLSDETVAYRVSRYWKVLNKPVHAMYPVSSPDFPVRLFNKRRVRFNGAPVDDKPIGFESSQVIEGHVVHDTFYSLHEMFNKLNIYTTRLCSNKKIRPSLVRALISPYFAFVKWYFIKGGWKDGRVGVVTGIYAFLYTFLKYFKSWYYFR